MKKYNIGDELLICSERQGHKFKATTGVRVDMVIAGVREPAYLVTDLEEPYQQGFVNGADLMDIDEVRQVLINNPKRI